MRKTKKTKPEPYEDMLRVEKLDPYEAQIKCASKTKQKTD